MKIKNNIVIQYFIVYILLLIGFLGVELVRIYGFTIFPDELGYWSYAAGIAGCDWSEVVALGSFYSFGYGLILTPIFLIFHNSLVAYYVAIIGNAFFLILSFYILVQILTEIYGNKKSNSMATMIALSMPFYLFYMRMTMVESLLTILYLLLCYVMIKYLKNENWRYLVGIIVIDIALVMTHMRCIGVAAVSVMVVIFHIVYKKKKLKQTLIFLAILLAMGIGFLMLRNVLTNLIYQKTDEGLLDQNKFVGQVDKVLMVLNIKYLWIFIQSIAGKLYYLGTATYGLFWCGILKIVKDIIKYFKKGQINHSKVYFYFFILLATAAQIMLVSVYTIQLERADMVTYGRYNEYVITIVVALGVIYVCKEKNIWKSLLGITIAEIVMTILTSILAIQKGFQELDGLFIVGNGYLLTMGYDSKTYYWYTLGISVLIMILVTFFLKICFRKERRHKAIIIIAVFEFACGIFLCNSILGESDMASFRDLQIIDEIKENIGDRQYLVYIEDGGLPLIDQIQFMERNLRIDVYQQYPDQLSPEEMVVVDHASPDKERLREMFRYEEINGHFALYYNK